MKNLWRPISELDDNYTPNLLLRAAELYDGESNQEGVARGYWQDDPDNPNGGTFRCPTWIADFDYYEDIPVNPTHFIVIEGPEPFTDEEMDAAESANSDRYLWEMAEMQASSLGVSPKIVYENLKKMQTLRLDPDILNSTDPLSLENS